MCTGAFVLSLLLPLLPLVEDNLRDVVAVGVLFCRNCLWLKEKYVSLHSEKEGMRWLRLSNRP